MKKLFPILSLILCLSACKDDPVFNNPKSMDLERIVDCGSRPHTILACPCEGDFVVLNCDLSSGDPELKLDRYTQEGELAGTMVDFMRFDQGLYKRYIPRDLALDEYKFLYVLCSPVSDTTGGSWQTESGFSILVFDPEEGFIKELDYADRDGGLARMLAYRDGRLYTCYSPEILEIEINSGRVEEISFPEDPGEEEVLLHAYSDMEFSPTGRPYFAGPYGTQPDSSTSRICQLDREFKTMESYPSRDSHRVFASMIGSPGLAIHEDGDVFLATFYGSGLEVYNKGMDFLFSHSLEDNSGQEPLPIDVATYRDRVYVADYANSQIRIYTCNY